MTGARPRSVALGDVRLAYEDRGTGGRPLVLVHGFTGSRDDFADVADALADLGRLVVLDQRGHGDSSKPGGGYDFDHLVADLRGLFDAAGIGQADLLGHSLGGMVALRFALAHPERVASLILMDTGARAVPVLGQAFERAIASVRRNGMSRLVAASAATPLAGEELQIARIEGEERYRARARAKLEALDPEAFIALATYLGEHPSVVDRLGEIRCPVTVIVGSEDAPFLPLADELARGIAGAALVRIAGAGHSPQKSGRAAWLEAVRAHLGRVRAAPS
jgi:pimeloyl-ACP methyl ester carboxylesterase